MQTLCEHRGNIVIFKLGTVNFFIRSDSVIANNKIKII